MLIDIKSDGRTDHGPQASQKLTIVFSSGELIIYAINDVFVKKGR